MVAGGQRTQSKWTVVETEELRRASIFTLAMPGALLTLRTMVRVRRDRRDENGKESDKLWDRVSYRKPILLKRSQLKNDKSEAHLRTKE
jgi:hypothetical protein